MPRTGKLFIIVGPSGVGKGTLVNLLREQCPQFYYPPSVTTRTPRAGEKDGEVYNFISDDEFEVKRKAGEFLEWAVVHATRKYATLKAPILNAVNKGKTVIREVDIQGLQSIRESFPPDQLVSIFLMPPDIETIKQRILKRQPDIDPAELTRRLASAKEEMDQKELADFEVVSRDGELDELVAEVLAVIEQFKS